MSIDNVPMRPAGDSLAVNPRGDCGVNLVVNPGESASLGNSLEYKGLAVLYESRLPPYKEDRRPARFCQAVI